MSLTEKINEQMKTALKSGDKLRLDTVRSLRAGIIEFEKSGIGRAMTPADEQDVLLRAAKKRKEAIEEYTKVGRSDVADRERAELAIIQEFLPKQLSEEEVEQRVQEIIKEQGASGPGDFNKIMPAAMKDLRGKADGALVQSIVKKLLA